MRLTLATLLAALALLGWATAAQASTAHRDAVLGATDAWISEQLRVPIAPRSDVPGAAGELKAGWAWVPCSDSSQARYDPGVLSAMTDRNDVDFQEAWAIALHEHEHLRGSRACVYVPGSTDVIDPTWSFYEEGFVESVRVDLFPAYMWRMFHLHVASYPMDVYARNVAVVRALSRYGTGSRTWRERAAVLWRRARLVEDWAARQEAIASAQGLVP